MLCKGLSKQPQEWVLTTSPDGRAFWHLIIHQDWGLEVYFLLLPALPHIVSCFVYLTQQRLLLSFPFLPFCRASAQTSPFFWRILSFTAFLMRIQPPFFTEFFKAFKYPSKWILRDLFQLSSRSCVFIFAYSEERTLFKEGSCIFILPSIISFGKIKEQLENLYCNSNIIFSTTYLF